LQTSDGGCSLTDEFGPLAAHTYRIGPPD
jgi:hypothetical protein